jgi:RHS repeat-associated protein
MPVLDTMTKAPTGSPTFTYGYTYTQASPGALRVGANGGAGQEDFMPFTVTRNASGGNPALTANRTYEGTRDALHKIENKAGGTVVSSYTYTVNPISQRESVVTAGTAFAGTAADWTWGYDALGQVTSADHANTNAADRAYQYDSIGNREKTANGTLTLPTGANWISNPLNQYTTADGVALPTTPAPAPFDLDGNLTAGPVPGSNGDLAGNQPPANATDIQWDAENRLIAMTIGGTSYTYIYDHLSRMTARTTNGVPSARFAYDGWNRIAQYSTSALQTTYTWGLDLSGTLQGAGGVGGLLATRISSGASYMATYDGNGNVSEYLVISNGGVIVHFEYDPFGRLTRTTGTAQSLSRFEFRFSTKPRDAATGLYYYGYRWYDPYTGRWINRDPIEEEGGVNLYGFVGNDALADFDVLGLRPRPPWDLNGCWQPQPDIRPTKISGDAGIDVKPAVDKTLAEVDKFFESLTPDQKVCACQAIALDNAHMLIFYPLLWDIQELRTIIPGTDGGDWHPGEEGRTYWGYGAATWVLTFGGEPYTSYSINYALWGRMYKNCATTDRDKFSIGNAQIIVNTCKLMQTFVEGVLPKPLGQYETMPVDINGATAFTQYGYTGTLPPDPRGCLRSLFNPSSKKLDKVLEWRWLPYKE